MSDELLTVISQGAKDLNIVLPPDAEAAFGIYCDFLKLHGQNVNLTSIEGDKDIARLHFLDSTALLNTTDFINKRVIDIGSGAGFPGFPLKIAEPSIDITLLDATGKRVEFLKELCEKLDIKATCINARAEEVARNFDYRERFDIVVSRAVAKMNMLCELCLPFVIPGGYFIAMKSTDSDEEISQAENAVKTLGAAFYKTVDYQIPGTEIIHRAVLIKKTESTPEKYPRRFSKIQKSPLQ